MEPFADVGKLLFFIDDRAFLFMGIEVKREQDSKERKSKRARRSVRGRRI